MSGRRVLVVSSTFPQFAGDERGGFVLRHWERAARAGDEVHVLAPASTATDGSLRCALKVERFAYAPRPLATLTGRFGIFENVRDRWWRAALIPGYCWSLERALQRALARREYDLVAAHFWLPSGVAVARRCAGRVPFEVYGHGTDVDLVLAAPPTLRRWIARSLARADAIYLPSRHKRTRVLEGLDWRPLESKLHVRHMADTVHLERPTASANPGHPSVLFLGRLIEQKGVDVLLEAAANVPGLQVVIAGDGPLRKTLTKRAQVLNVDARFVGWVEGATKATLLQRANAVVIPSRTRGQFGEGAPLVVAEAHAAGRPIIASKLAGIEEIASAVGATPLLVPPNDAARLAHALHDLMREAPTPPCDPMNA